MGATIKMRKDICHNRLVDFESYDEFHGKRILKTFLIFSYLGLVLATLYLLFDYKVYGNTPYWNGVLTTRLIAIFFAVMVIVAVAHSFFKNHRVEAITFFGTLGYTAITYGYIAFNNDIHFVGYNWVYYLVATIMIGPLITKKIYIIMESYQILIVLILFVLFDKSSDEIFIYTIFSIPLAIYVFAVVALNRKNGEEAYENAYQMHITASIDVLSNLLNRRSWYDRSRGIFAHNKGLSFIMLDIDHFKKVNDTYGHDAGDIVIKMVADTLMEETREKDVVGRLGGEEFGIVLPQTSLDEAVEIGERIRKAIESKSVKYGDLDLSVTISLGATHSESNDDLEAVVKIGDTNLYKSKQNGRNRISF
jgi:diguanylate cyclase (GGDEF)-like protein